MNADVAPGVAAAAIVVGLLKAHRCNEVTTNVGWDSESEGYSVLEGCGRWQGRVSWGNSLAIANKNTATDTVCSR